MSGIKIQRVSLAVRPDFPAVSTDHVRARASKFDGRCDKREGINHRPYTHRSRFAVLFSAVIKIDIRARFIGLRWPPASSRSDRAMDDTSVISRGSIARSLQDDTDLSY